MSSITRLATVTDTGDPIAPFWKRFVDDIITALPKVSVQPFLNHLSSIEETINFTAELESNGEYNSEA